MPTDSNISYVRIIRYILLAIGAVLVVICMMIGALYWFWQSMHTYELEECVFRGTAIQRTGHLFAVRTDGKHILVIGWAGSAYNSKAGNPFRLMVQVKGAGVDTTSVEVPSVMIAALDGRGKNGLQIDVPMDEGFLLDGGGVAFESKDLIEFPTSSFNAQVSVRLMVDNGPEILSHSGAWDIVVSEAVAP